MLSGYEKQLKKRTEKFKEVKENYNTMYEVDTMNQILCIHYV